MTYTRWQTNWQNDPPGGTPIVAGFLNQAESTLGDHDARVATLESQTFTLSSADGSGASWKLLVMPDGSLKAVPRSATATSAPTGVSRAVHLTFVNLTWSATAGAVSYLVYRDGTLIANTGSTYYNNSPVVSGTTYSYYVVAVNIYGMYSPPSASVTAFINPALNSAPVFDSITVWPLNPAVNDLVYVHVNAHDVDAQQIAITLNTTVGALAPHPWDASTWIWTGV